MLTKDQFLEQFAATKTSDEKRKGQDGEAKFDFAFSNPQYYKALRTFAKEQYWGEIFDFYESFKDFLNEKNDAAKKTKFNNIVNLYLIPGAKKQVNLSDAFVQSNSLISNYSAKAAEDYLKDAFQNAYVQMASQQIRQYFPAFLSSFPITPEKETKTEKKPEEKVEKKPKEKVEKKSEEKLSMDSVIKMSKAKGKENKEKSKRSSFFSKGSSSSKGLPLPEGKEEESKEELVAPEKKKSSSIRDSLRDSWIKLRSLTKKSDKDTNTDEASESAESTKTKTSSFKKLS